MMLHASERGDVMRVTSLLNSGVNVDAELIYVCKGCVVLCFANVFMILFNLLGVRDSFNSCQLLGPPTYCVPTPGTRCKG